MNIKEHIEAGHYPTDEKGRALVPTNGGVTFTVVATDRPDMSANPLCIVGWYPTGAWGAFSAAGGNAEWQLRPPPPRKVKVTGWAEVVGSTINTFHFHKGFAEAAAAKTNEWSKTVNGGTYRVVELTGEYEEPWS